MSDVVHVESTLFFETLEQIFLRVFSVIRPRTDVPAMRVEFCPFANANSFIRLEAGALAVRLTDVLRDAPAPILEALAFILVSKLYRRPVPRSYVHRYRLYLNRRDVRHAVQGVRKERGRKQIRHPKGEWFDLEELFEDLNIRYFHGLMARPVLGWSARHSRTTLGHYDPSHHMIVLSRVLDQQQVPRLAVEYVMFHEMLHLRHPVNHKGTRRCVHTPEFKLAEKEFKQLCEAKEMLRRLP
jgi:SprT-like family